jgi:hypothetical protein
MSIQTLQLVLELKVDLSWEKDQHFPQLQKSTFQRQLPTSHESKKEKPGVDGFI